MTASDHATKPLRNTLRERGHPYMTLGANPFLQRHHASAEQIDAGAGSVHGRGVISDAIGGGKTCRSGSGVGVVTAAGGLGWSCSTSHGPERPR